MQSQTTGQDNKNGAVAQSVEQRTENPCVAGSIPAHTTSKASEKSGAFLFYRFFSRYLSEPLIYLSFHPSKFIMKNKNQGFLKK